MSFSLRQANVMAKWLYGPGAVVARAKHPTDRHQRFRVACVSGSPAKLFIFGMGDSWDAAFKAAEDNPVAKSKQESVTQGRIRLKAAMDAEKAKETQDVSQQGNHSGQPGEGPGGAVPGLGEGSRELHSGNVGDLEGQGGGQAGEDGVASSDGLGEAG